jgi:hypothetical protein
MSQDSIKDNYRDNFLEILAEVEGEYYKPEETLSIRRFIERYEPMNDFFRISFWGNGGKGAELKDRNQDFRDKVSIFICLNNDINVPPMLLKDLIQEIGKASQDAWGVTEYVFLLAEQLLKETGAKYIESFGEMLFSNMDTYGACISIEFTDIDVKGILNSLIGKEQKSKLILDLIEYFEAHL